MSYEDLPNLAVSRQDGVLVVELNRPQRGNAIDAGLHTDLSHVFARIAADDAVRAVLLTGRGKAFSVGGEMDWFLRLTGPELDRLFVEARRIIVDLLEVEQPIVAAVNGPAVGLGATLALFCDVIFAAEDARIGDPHVRIGLAAGDGGAIIWPWLVGMARAKRYLLTGDLLGAREAQAMGLVNGVVQPASLRQEAMAFARRLAESPPAAVRGTKASINKILRDAVNLVLDTSLAREKPCFSTEDHRRAVAEFLAARRDRA